MTGRRWRAIEQVDGKVRVTGAEILADTTCRMYIDDGAGLSLPTVDTMPLWGDVNENGIVTLIDVCLIVQIFGGTVDYIP